MPSARAGDAKLAGVCFNGGMLHLSAIAVALAAALQGIPTRGSFASVQIGPEPNKAFTDIGPIQAPDVSFEADLRQRLQLLADEVGIDGFIVETRNPMIVYGVRPSGYQGNRDDKYAAGGADGAAEEAVEGLGVKTLRTVYGTKKEILYLRAYIFGQVSPERAAAFRDNAKKLFKGQIRLPDMRDTQRKLLSETPP
jgi:hypothetical protein